MRIRRITRTARLLAGRAALGMLLLIATDSISQAQQESILYSFQNGTDGANPQSDLTSDSSGNLYGTAYTGGIGQCELSDGTVGGCGTVFELSPPLNGGKWAYSVLYSFQGGNDGALPAGPLTFDRAGNLYGTTTRGGTGYCENGAGCGTVFELTPNAKGNPWTETILSSFQGGGEAAFPRTSLVLDEQGNIYGTTTAGGWTRCRHGCGAVFRLQPPQKQNGTWSETILYHFTGIHKLRDGSRPQGKLIRDAAGTLYGSALLGGSYNCPGGRFAGSCGIVFSISPPANHEKFWRKKTLYTYGGGADGARPYGGVTLDSQGNLYGTTNIGGDINYCEGNYEWGCGNVFELSPPSDGGSWSETTLYSFTDVNGDGAMPRSTLTFDTVGNLYGTTEYSDSSSCDYGGCGTVFELSPSSGGWSEQILYSFGGGSDGANPISGVIFDSAGNMFGTTLGGGSGSCNLDRTSGCGVVFELTP